jgi:hypothetical protein
MRLSTLLTPVRAMSHRTACTTALAGGLGCALLDQINFLYIAAPLAINIQALGRRIFAAI